jgi:hypothetical protein
MESSQSKTRIVLILTKQHCHARVFALPRLPLHSHAPAACLTHWWPGIAAAADRVGAFGADSHPDSQGDEGNGGALAVGFTACAEYVK